MLAQGGFALAIGLCLGSLATLLTHRLPRGEPVGWARSRCPRCERALTARDLVPVLSWAVNRGRCRACGAKVSWRYPAVEVALGGLCLAAWGAFGATWIAASVMVLALALTVAVLVDLEWMLLPDATLAVAGAAGLGWRAGTDGAWIEAAVAALLLGGLAWLLRAVFSRLRGMEALGLGDVKLMAVAGLWLPLGAVPAFLMLAGVLGIVTAKAWEKVTGDARFPFGPALAGSLYVTVLALGAAPAAVTV
jgi:leader peptidase (prepilin peptidase)/N-methyltransferase